MDKITEVKVKALTPGQFKQSYTMHYTQNGKQKTWDLIIDTDSLVVLVFDPTKNTFIFVKQFRPAVYYASIPDEDRSTSIDVIKYPPLLGITLELCSAPVTNQNLVDNARAAVNTNIGYNVPNTQFQRVATFRKGVGTNGSKQTLFYCEVADHMKMEQFVRTDPSEIVEMSMDDVQHHISQKVVRSPPDFLFAIYWFLQKKVKAPKEPKE